jgi:TolA-binding protein
MTKSLAEHKVTLLNAHYHLNAEFPDRRKTVYEQAIAEVYLGSKDPGAVAARGPANEAASGAAARGDDSSSDSEDTESESDAKSGEADTMEELRQKLHREQQKIKRLQDQLRQQQQQQAPLLGLETQAQVDDLSRIKDERAAFRIIEAELRSYGVTRGSFHVTPRFRQAAKIVMSGATRVHGGVGAVEELIPGSPDAARRALQLRAKLADDVNQRGAIREAREDRFEDGTELPHERRHWAIPVVAFHLAATLGEVDEDLGRDSVINKLLPLIGERVRAKDDVAAAFRRGLSDLAKDKKALEGALIETTLGRRDRETTGDAPLRPPRQGGGGRQPETGAVTTAGKTAEKLVGKCFHHNREGGCHRGAACRFRHE